MSSIPYSTDTRHVILLERGRSQTTELKIHRDSSQKIPTGGTYTLTAPNGSKIVDAEAVTISGPGTCSYTLSAAQLKSDLKLSEGYLEEWNITLSDGNPIFRRAAAVVRRRLYPVLSTQDLTDYYSQLNDLLPSNLTSYQQYIDTSWNTILRKIASTGMGYSYLIMSPDSFFESHLHLTLSRIFQDFHSSLGNQVSHYFELSNQHFDRYRDEWSAINFLYDEENENEITNPEKRTGGSPTIYLNNPPLRRSYPRRRFR